jgi:deoxyribonuclease V
MFFVHTPETLALTKVFKQKQEQLREKVILQKISQPIRVIAGCDSAFIGEDIFSVFVLFSYPDLEELEVQTHRSRVTLPYIPGFLAFREMPNLLLAYDKLTMKPDLIMVDGNGIMHPRRMGIATQLGITLAIPTIGIAKKKLFGKYVEPEVEKGSHTFVYDKQEKIAVALRSKDKVQPIFVSPGHLCDLETAHEIVIQTLYKHKLPEPTRIADKYSKTMKNNSS